MHSVRSVPPRALSVWLQRASTVSLPATRYDSGEVITPEPNVTTSDSAVTFLDESTGAEKPPTPAAIKPSSDTKSIPEVMKTTVADERNLNDQAPPPNRFVICKPLEQPIAPREMATAESDVVTFDEHHRRDLTVSCTAVVLYNPDMANARKSAVEDHGKRDTTSPEAEVHNEAVRAVQEPGDHGSNLKGAQEPTWHCPIDMVEGGPINLMAADTVAIPAALLEEDTRSLIIDDTDSTASQMLADPQSLNTEIGSEAVDMSIFDALGDIEEKPLFVPESTPAPPIVEKSSSSCALSAFSDEVAAFLRNHELQDLVAQPYCSKHPHLTSREANELLISITDHDLSKQQKCQRLSRERIVCCKFEPPYLETCGGRPEWSLSELAIFAIVKSLERRLTLPQISKWICKRFPYYESKVVDRLAEIGYGTTQTWMQQLRAMLQQDDFPTEPVVVERQLYFYIPPGREWVFLQRDRTKQRGFTRFEELPKELRELMYFWALPLRSKSGWTVPAEYIDKRHKLQMQKEEPDVRLTTRVDNAWTLFSRQMRDLLSVTRASRRCHVEASGVFYRHTHFVFGEQTSKHLHDGCKTLLGFLKGLNARDPRTRTMLRHITLHYNPEGQRNPCATAFNLLAEAKLRYLHIHINEGVLLTNGKSWGKNIAQAPGMKKLAQARGLKRLTFSGMFMRAQAFLERLTDPKKGDVDDEELARAEEKRRLNERQADIRRRQRDKALSQPGANHKTVTKRYNLLIDRALDINTAENRPKRAKRKQADVKDIFDEDDLSSIEGTEVEIVAPAHERNAMPKKKPKRLRRRRGSVRKVIELPSDSETDTVSTLGRRRTPATGKLRRPGDSRVQKATKEANHGRSSLTQATQKLHNSGLTKKRQELVETALTSAKAQGKKRQRADSDDEDDNEDDNDDIAYHQPAPPKKRGRMSSGKTKPALQEDVRPRTWEDVKARAKQLWAQEKARGGKSTIARAGGPSNLTSTSGAAPAAYPTRAPLRDNVYVGGRDRRSGGHSGLRDAVGFGKHILKH